jgi:4-hydroxybenzoate polyprenyltransferase
MQESGCKFGVFNFTGASKPFVLDSPTIIQRHFFEKPILNFGPVATIIENNYFKSVKEFSTKYGPANDMYSNLKAAKGTSVAVFPFPLVDYRIHECQEMNNKYGYLANNYLYLRDALHELDLPLSSTQIKYISKKNALILYIFLNALAITAALLVLDPFIIIISVFSIALLYLYSLKLKQSIFWGNLTVALLSALPILEMYVFFKPFGLEIEFIAYALFAFLTSLIREIVKDKEDAEGDLKSGINTLANSISEKHLKIILMSVNSLLLISLLSFLFLLKIETNIALGFYLMSMILPGILLFFLIGRLKNKKSYSNTSLYLKIYMFLGLIRLWL